ncbi:MAG TPA: transglutaminase domain-containing protein [Candidatus Polarisedimenticolia bacterium]|jgi:transglutaminase-like putative cysteine protease|nr:transglutaminase domain-containing protein [Candidatus Polarisedimenticolia bacterium]
MNRREFLLATAGLPVAAWGLSGSSRAQSSGPSPAPPASAGVKEFAPRPGPWRTFEITTHVEVQRPAGMTRLWLPLPGVVAEYQDPLDNHWTGNARLMEEHTDPAGMVRLLYAEFAPGEPAPTLEVSSRVQARDRAVDWSKTIATTEDKAGLNRCIAPTNLIPTDGIVLETARAITRGKRTDVEKARAVYDWVLATMYREPRVRGCGVGDIKAILETKNFGGKCADINALFVGLLRAAGVPARDVYGIRVAPSAFGYKTLGAASATITKSQHCRAEVFLHEHGWVAMDPADVAKVAREETGERVPLEDPLVVPVRRRLFGAWEGNWIGFNTAHDVALPNAIKKDRLGFLMYPQGETAEGRLDCLDADSFKYSITTRELTA